MRSAISALAILAGVAPTLAVPGGDSNPWEKKAGGWSGGSWGRHSRPGGYWGAPSDAPLASSSGVEVSPVFPVPTGSGISGTGSGYPTGPGYWSNATATGGYQTTTIVTVTEIVTSSTTVCPYESEYTSGTDTLTSSGTTTSTVETTYLSTITITSTYPAGPGGYGGSPATSTPVSSASESSTDSEPTYGSGTDPSSSPDSPAGGSSSAPGAPSYGGSSPGSSALTVVTDVASPTSQAAPQTVVPVPYGDYTPSEWVSHPWGPHTTVIVSHSLTTYTSECSYEETHTRGGSTVTSSGITTSTLTSTVEITLTLTTTVSEAPSSSPAGPVGASTTPLAPVTVTPTTGSGSGPSSSPAGGDGGSPPHYGGSSSPAGPTDGSSTAPAGPGGYGSSSSPAGPASGSSTTPAGPGGYGGSTSSDGSGSGSTGSVSTSSTPSSPVTGTISITTSGETSFTTFETTCTESGNTTLHTHSAPITTSTPTGSNVSTTSSSPVGPIGTGSSPAGYPSGSYSIPPYGGSNGTTSSVSGPVTGSTTSSSVSGPITGSSSSSSSETSFTTFETTCTENGTTTLHTHSQPITTSATISYNGTSTTPVGPIGTGSTSSSISSSVSGSISHSANVTSSSATSYTTFETTCTENGTTTLHTHSQPLTASASASATYSAGNTTSAGPTGTGSTSSSTSSTSSATPTHSGCVPCEGQPGSDPEKFCGYTIKDNPYKVLPKTCKTREFTFEITNTTLSPDGVERMVLAVNGQVPGPLVEAYWGDNIVVHVKNSMQNNGSTIHWHGQRMNYTNEQDGVASITQCPIAPGESYTYNFTAGNYGFSWYHAHYALQAYEGVFGPMLVHGPKSIEGDYDEVPISLNDWTHVPVDMMYDAAQTVGPRPQTGPRTMDTGLINGQNVWNNGGSRWSLDVEQGETKILHFINAAIQSTYILSIDGHSFQVIANDYVPIVPYTATSVAINPGQRYSILVKFDQPSGNYWLRSDNQNDCAPTTQWNDIKAIIHYSDAAAGTPSSTAQTYQAGCYDEKISNLVPAFAIDAGVSNAAPQVETVAIGGNGGTPNLYKWTLNNVTFESEWDHPTLLSIYDNDTVPTYSGPLVVEIPNLGEWVYFIIQSPIPFPHPIHLHGHDFHVLAQGTGLYNSGVALNLKNPPRRDTAMMPWDPVGGTGGYLVLAFETDNPGAWLMHCHIGWHNAMGFALQIVENQAGIASTVNDPDTLHNTCSSYSEYAIANNIHTHDSGV